MLPLGCLPSLRVSISGTLGDIDPLNKVPFKRAIRSVPLRGILPRKAAGKPTASRYKQRELPNKGLNLDPQPSTKKEKTTNDRTKRVHMYYKYDYGINKVP